MEWKRVNGLCSIQARWQTGRHVFKLHGNGQSHKTIWSPNSDHS
jgi:hypothetical protein